MTKTAEARRSAKRIRSFRVLFSVLACVFLPPAIALAAFPGADPDESVRVNTPAESNFDRCEPDDEDGTQDCTNVFDQSWERFGFAPKGTETTATYKNDGCAAAISTLTLSLCGDPHTRRLIEQNLAAGRSGPGQVSGVSADRAWKRSLGDPDVEVAILDTGIRWSEGQLRTKISLNPGELPSPQNNGGPSLEPGGDCSTFTGSGDDLNDDGAFNVIDFACDNRVAVTDGHDEADASLDASDLIAAFSDGDDDDANGYADDIAGWDFFDDDNDPYDASSYSSASNHGTGRAEEAAELTDDAGGDTALCPECQIVPLRVWDTFVVDTNFYAQGVAYAADNKIEVVEGAIGGLTNSRFTRETFERAYEKGVFMAIVSSDLNTESHNFPTTYDEVMMVQGTVADVNGLGIEVPGASDLLIGLNSLLGGLEPLLDPLLGPLGITPPAVGTELPVGTWFRNSGTTQYGGHAHVAMPGTTGSQATGQAAGAAGLIQSYAKERIASDNLPGPPILEPNEIKQIMTMTAEDVLADNTDAAAGATGAVAALPPDPAQRGWDRHFGYGRPDLGLALETIAEGKIPPQALITSPDWFAPFNVEQQDTVEIAARMSAERVADSTYDWRLEWAPGVEPAESEFAPGNVIAEGSNQTGEIEGPLGVLDLNAVRDALDSRQLICNSVVAVPPATGGDTVVSGGAACDPTGPGKAIGDVNPHEPAFTVRLVVTDSAGNRGEDRKVMFAYREPDAHEGTSRPIGGERDDLGVADSGGEASQRMYDLNGDNRLEIIEATSSGELHVFEEDGTPLQSFNGGDPVTTESYSNVHESAPFYDQVDPPAEALRTPAIGDIDGDLEPEIVDTAGEHIYAWEADGSPVAGFPFRADPANSRVEDRTKVNHVKPGFIGSPSLGNLDGDPELEIVAAALDQHLYGLDGDGSQLAGFPVYLRERDANGDPLPCTSDFECAESINTPAIGDMNGDGTAEIVIATNEFADNPAQPGIPDDGDLTGLPGTLVTLLTANALGGDGRVYAVSVDGQILDGWPVKTPGTLPDALPLIGPGHDYVLGDVDGAPGAEAIGAVTTGELQAFTADGSSAATYPSIPQVGGTPLALKTLSFFEYPILADLDSTFAGPEVAKAGISLTGLLNVGVTTGLNLPYNHLMQAWGNTVGGNPTLLPAYPVPIEDYQLLSSPAAADVSDAPGVELLAGTGQYLIRNLNGAGEEGTGWPKFTGGWAFAVPAIGDVDKDGLLEVSVMTREGFSFMWDTERPACTEDAGDNQQWWTSRHDEWSSGAYDTDSRPPGAPEDLTATRQADGSVRVTWTAPGDDWLCGTADRIRILTSDGAIANPDDGSELGTDDVEDDAGATVERIFSATEVASSKTLAVMYRDEAGNWGWLAAIRVPPAKDDGNPGPSSCRQPSVGTGGSDVFRGGPGADGYRGRGGADEIRGKGGNDCLNGDEGADQIAGGDDDDRIKGGKGSDGLKGGGDRDRIRGSKGGDTMRGGRGEDDLHGQPGKDSVAGGGGDDDLRAGKGRDRVAGGAGDDMVNVLGGGKDSVKCGAGDDVVKAGPRDQVHASCEAVQGPRR